MYFTFKQDYECREKIVIHVWGGCNKMVFELDLEID